MVDDLDELGKLTDVNLAGAWLNIGGHGGEVGGSPGCPFVATGLPAAFFNGVYPTGPVDDPDQLIADATAFMAARGVPWLLWVREGVDDALLDAGRRAGLTDAGGPLAMALPAIPEIPPLPDGLEITVVSDLAGLEVARDLGARGFGMPREFIDVLAAESMLDDPTVVMVTGSVDEVPVSTALVAVTGTTAGIYNVATPPEHRRRGYGEALTWAAVAEGRRIGCDHSALQASPMGAPIYRRMGFVDLGTYVQLADEPTALPGSMMTGEKVDD
jgi:GNAT superfamily N-acetyltransferase